MPKIHPTAVINPAAIIADDVEIGPGCVVESDVEIGPGCVLREYVIVRRHTTLGTDNLVDAHTVLGGEPQDLSFDPKTVSHLRIGDGNVFREGVTISRGSKAGGATVIGNRSYWMACSHAGHDAIVEDDAVLANSALLAGHCRIGRRTFLSAHVVVHQFVWVGEGVMTRGNSGIGTHVPPFCMVAGINHIHGLNSIGLRRNPEITTEDRRQIKEAFKLTYRSGLLTTDALARMDECADWGEPAQRFRQFIRDVIEAKKPYNRSLCPMRSTRGSSAAHDE